MAMTRTPVAAAATAVLLACSAAGAPPQRVGVIGGGIGGASFAYFYKKAVPNAEVVVFETRDYVGGRLKHTTMHNTTIELGGDAWSTAANEYIVQLAKELGGDAPLPALRRRRRRRPAAARSDGVAVAAQRAENPSHHQSPHRVGDPPLEGVAIWNGTALTPVSEEIRDLLGDARLVGIEAEFLAHLRSNYALRGARGTFGSVPEFLGAGGLTPYTAVSARSFFDGRRLPRRLQDDVLEPLSRGIYDQALDEMQAFSAIVAVTSLLGAASFDGGNSELVRRMLDKSGADVRLSTRVVEVASANAAASAAAGGADAGFAMRSQTGGRNGSLVHVEAVVVAAPVEVVGAAFPPTARLPPPRPFRHIWVTVVRAAGVSPSYFGLPAGSKVPYDNILTTQSSAQTGTPFVVVESEATLPDGTGLWKLFSNDDVRPWLPKIFSGLSTDPSDTVVQHWNYTFPVLTPVNGSAGGPTYQPVTLDPSGVFYVNTMESVASAMEGSIIAGRNLAFMLAKR